MQDTCLRCCFGDYRDLVEQTGVARVTGTTLKRVHDVTLGLSFSGLVSSDKIPATFSSM